MTPHHPLEGLELDLCPHGDGIWFDESELGALIAKLKSQQASGELAHLDHVFSLLATTLGGIPCRTR
jgi:Zn-finger nucleic acid-binding protein